ncbi:hypothetical protein YPPY64_3670, partial [Yersinia pestis PY-64]
MTSTTIDYISC